MLHLWSPQPLCPTMLADRGTGTCSGGDSLRHDRGHPPTPNLEPQLQGMDPEAVPTPTNSHSGSNHLQGRLLCTWAHTEDGRLQPLHHSTGRHRLPELPCRHQAPQRATPGEERPDTIHPHHEVHRRQPDPDMGRHPGQDHHSREGDQADDLCQPCGKQALPEPILMQGPGSGARQLPGGPADSHHQEQPDHGPPGRSHRRRAGRQNDQTLTCRPHHHPHQIMLLPHQVPTTRQAHITTIPGDGGKQTEDGGVPAQLVLLQLVQYM